MNFYSSSPISEGSIRYSRGNLEIINQLLLPFETVYETVCNVKEGFRFIQSMKVQGGPAIALVAILSLAVEIHKKFYNNDVLPPFNDVENALEYIQKNLEYFKTARQTPYTFFYFADILWETVNKEKIKANDAEDIFVAYMEKAEALLKKEEEDNNRIVINGEKYILANVLKNKENFGIKVLTHGNYGELSCIGVGTALGIVKQLYNTNNLKRVYCTETRPFNHGSRLSAFELLSEKIPCTIVCDSMISSLFSQTKIDVIIVGADRIAANGDIIGTIGTYQLAIIAKYYKIMFIVAAPTSIIDKKSKTGNDVEIEKHSRLEVMQIRGEVVDDEANVKEPIFRSASWDSDKYTNGSTFNPTENSEDQELYTEDSNTSDSLSSLERDDDYDDEDEYDEEYDEDDEYDEEEDEDMEDEDESNFESMDYNEGEDKNKDKEKAKMKINNSSSSSTITKSNYLLKKMEKYKDKNITEEEINIINNNITKNRRSDSYSSGSGNHYNSNTNTSHSSNTYRKGLRKNRSESKKKKKDFSLNSTQTLITKLGQNVIDVIEGIEECMRFNVHNNNYSLQSTLEPHATSMTVKISAPGVDVYSPSYDITPSNLVSAIITENGIILRKNGRATFDFK